MYNGQDQDNFRQREIQMASPKKRIHMRATKVKSDNTAKMDPALVAIAEKYLCYSCMIDIQRVQKRLVRWRKKKGKATAQKQRRNIDTSPENKQ